MCVAMCVVVSAVLVAMMLVLLCAVRCCRSHTHVLPERDDDAVEFVFTSYILHTSRLQLVTCFSVLSTRLHVQSPSKADRIQPDDAAAARCSLGETAV